MEPNIFAGYYNRGILYKKRRDLSNAIKDFDKAINLEPNLALAYCNRAFSYEDLKDYRQAIRDFDKAIELEPNNSDFYYFRGSLYWLYLKDELQAFENLKTAARLGNKSAQDILKSQGIEW